MTTSTLRAAESVRLDDLDGYRRLLDGLVADGAIELDWVAALRTPLSGTCA